MHDGLTAICPREGCGASLFCGEAPALAKFSLWPAAHNAQHRLLSIQYVWQPHEGKRRQARAGLSGWHMFLEKVAIPNSASNGPVTLTQTWNSKSKADMHAPYCMGQGPTVSPLQKQMVKCKALVSKHVSIWPRRDRRKVILLVGTSEGTLGHTQIRTGAW